MYQLISSLFLVLLLTACSKVDGANPSQNKALNEISGKEQSKNGGYMQHALDNWLKSDWTPSVEKDESIKKKNEDQSRDFTLQEYADKIAAYNKEHNSSDAESHKNKISSMPVIGTPK